MKFTAKDGSVYADDGSKIYRILTAEPGLLLRKSLAEDVAAALNEKLGSST